MSSYPRSRQTNLVVQETENELLIYDLQNDKAYCLNETSALVWQFCDGTNSVAGISRLLTEKLAMIVSEELVWLALERLKKEGLLEKSDTLEISFGGLTRREAVRKAGLASLVAFPLIVSVIAPSALAAQSAGSGTLGFLQCCTTNSSCASGNCVMAGSLLRCCDSAAPMSPTPVPGNPPRPPTSLSVPNSPVGCINVPNGQTCAPLNSRCCSNLAVAQATGLPVCPVGTTHQCVCSPAVSLPFC